MVKVKFRDLGSYMADEQQNDKLNEKIETMSPLSDADVRRTRLKSLIILGKERGYLT